jgi:hypothetical protein
MSAAPAITMPTSIRRRGPKRSTMMPASQPNSGPTTSLLSALPDVTCWRDHPRSFTKKS